MKPEHLFDAPVDLVQRHVGLFVQFVSNVLAHGQRIEERTLLKDHAQVAPDGHHLVLRQLVHALAVHPHDAAVGAQQPGDDFERGRLA